MGMGEQTLHEHPRTLDTALGSRNLPTLVVVSVKAGDSSGGRTLVRANPNRSAWRDVAILVSEKWHPEFVTKSFRTVII